ncbi:Hypothetical protein R9X50_00700500 [Acrodontium crateriforme]|uniref:Cytochrome c oxidase assembly protein COX20, mitochondrial n=1 Tax=Acrodontium crateriforme TaxID=150365 RepID=A0AAQ3MA93_9PEZI|nr:Hypothetical protein R9X50_00700500 [Acrodontium crateriforme]
MADDTRKSREDLSREALNVNPDNKAFTGQQWAQQGGKLMPYTPPENANMMAGGTEHTAGGKTPEVSLGNAVKDITWNDFTELHKRPCVRDALLTGMTGGFALGGVRAIFGASIFTACSWAVGTFCAGSSVAYQYCYYKRHAEKEGMMRAVEILQKKDEQKRARELHREKMKEQRRELKEKEQDAQFAALHAKDGSSGKPWWKVW